MVTKVPSAACIPRPQVSLLCHLTKLFPVVFLIVLSSFQGALEIIILWYFWNTSHSYMDRVKGIRTHFCTYTLILLLGLSVYSSDLSIYPPIYLPPSLSLPNSSLYSIFIWLCIGKNTNAWSDDGHVGKCELTLCSVKCLRNKIALYAQ